MKNILNDNPERRQSFSDLQSTELMTSTTKSSESNADSCIPPIECLELRSPLYKSDKDSSMSSSASSSTASPKAMETDAFHGMYFENDDEADYESPAYYDEACDEDEDEEDEDEDDDDESCDSTVVNGTRPGLVRPPLTASKEEQARYYWDICYGKPSKKHVSEKPPRKTWSVNRVVTTKSCISARKTPWSEIAASASKRRTQTMGRANLSTPSSLQNVTFPEETVATTPIISTPKNINGDSARRGVKFGCAAAVEFDTTRPIHELTPLPAAQARARFPMDEKANESDEESHQLHRETARNAAQLAEWEDDFDSYVDGWGEGDSDIEEDGENIEFDGNFSPQNENHTRRTTRNSDRRSRERRDRRSSTFYSKSGGSLIERNDDENEAEQTEVKMYGDSLTQSSDDGGSRTIYVDQKSKVSPLHCPSHNDSLHFSSPSNSNALFRFSSSASEESKETPKTDVTSSSSLLRSVHSAGGATLGRGSSTTCDDAGLEKMKPNQLDSALQKAEVSISHDCAGVSSFMILNT